MKHCRDCRVELTPETRSPSAVKYHRLICKRCESVRVCAWARDNKKTKNAASKRWREKNPSRRKAVADASRLKIKLEVLRHYGNGDCRCIDCQFSDIRALSIDHIHAFGNQHRKAIKGRAGNSFYHWLKKNGFPLGYQTLCMNCQFIKKHTSDLLKSK